MSCLPGEAIIRVYSQGRAESCHLHVSRQAEEPSGLGVRARLAAATHNVRLASSCHSVRPEEECRDTLTLLVN